MRLHSLLPLLALLVAQAAGQDPPADAGKTTNSSTDTRPRIPTRDEILGQMPPITPIRTGNPQMDAFYMMFPALGSLLRWGSLFPAYSFLGAIPDDLQPSAAASKVVLVLAEDATAKTRVARQNTAPNPLGQLMNWPQDFQMPAMPDFGPQVGSFFAQLPTLPSMPSLLGAAAPVPAAAPAADPAPPAPAPAADPPASAAADTVAQQPILSQAALQNAFSFLNPANFDASSILGQGIPQGISQLPQLPQLPQLSQSIPQLPPPNMDFVAQMQKQFFPQQAAGTDAQASDISEVRVRPEVSYSPEAQMAQQKINAAMEKEQEKEQDQERVPLLWFRMPSTQGQDASEEKTLHDLRVEAKLRAFEHQVIAELKMLQKIELLAKQMRSNAAAQSGDSPNRVSYPLSRTPVHKITRADIEQALRDDYVRRLVNKEAQRKARNQPGHTNQKANGLKRQAMPQQTLSKEDIVQVMAYAYRMANEQMEAEKGKQDKMYAAYRNSEGQTANQQAQEQRQMDQQRQVGQNSQMQRQWSEDQAKIQQNEQQRQVGQNSQMQRQWLGDQAKIQQNEQQRQVGQNSQMQRQWSEDQAKIQQNEQQRQVGQNSQMQRQWSEDQAQIQLNEQQRQVSQTSQIIQSMQQQRQWAEEQAKLLQNEQQRQVSQDSQMIQTMQQQRQWLEDLAKIQQNEQQRQVSQDSQIIQTMQQQRQMAEDQAKAQGMTQQNPTMMQQRQWVEDPQVVQQMQQRQWAEDEARMQQRQMMEQQRQLSEEQAQQNAMMMQQMQQRQMMQESPAMMKQRQWAQENPQSDQQPSMMMMQQPRMEQTPMMMEQVGRNDDPMDAIVGEAGPQMKENEGTARHKVDFLGIGGNKRKKFKSNSPPPTVINYYYSAPVQRPAAQGYGSSYGTSYGGGGYGSNAYGVPSPSNAYRAAVGNDEVDSMLRQHQTMARTINPIQQPSQVGGSERQESSSNPPLATTPAPQEQPQSQPQEHRVQKSSSSAPSETEIENANAPSSSDPQVGSIYTYGEGLLHPFMGLLPVDRPDDPWNQKPYDPHHPLYSGGGSYAAYLKDGRHRRDTHIMGQGSENGILTPGMLERLLRIKVDFQRRFPHLYQGMLNHHTNLTRVEVQPPVLGNVTKPKVKAREENETDEPVFELGAAERSLFEDEANDPLENEPEPEPDEEDDRDVEEPKESGEPRDISSSRKYRDDNDIDYFNFDDDDVDDSTFFYKANKNKY
nr:defective chorion-1 protein, FC125 isoform isoform X3 [Drosophila suzukii]